MLSLKPPKTSPLAPFHPAVAAWFERRLGAPTEVQALAWPEIRAGHSVLVAAPTGSGKTLAAFLAAIDVLVRRGLEGELTDATEVLYVSPLKALSNDVEKNLAEPLAGIRAELAGMELPDVEIRTMLRTGDTPAATRTAMARRPPHLLVTTPESLYILLTSESGRRMLSTVRTVIVDEIHAVAGSKRGSHLALSLARLESLVESNGGSLSRIGLSATQKPIEEIGRFLAGRDAHGLPRPISIVDVGRKRRIDAEVTLPGSPLSAVMSGEVWDEVYDILADQVRAHRTTLIFANTRRLAERAARHLETRLGEGRVSSHHGSLSRDRRLAVEDRLKRGELAALVATSSLELGIDIGAVDLVCQLGSTRAISTLLQRAGRSGHQVGGTPKVRIFPTTLGELAEAAALLDALRRGELDRVVIPQAPLDILAQQITAEVAAGERPVDELFALVRRAEPYRELAREDFDTVVDSLANGYATTGGRRGAHLHLDQVHGILRPRRGARLAAITSGGAIPDTADYAVLLEPAGMPIGTVHEDFAVESIQGDVFQLGNASWRILRVEPGKVRVEDAHGAAPTIPFWLGEAAGRTDELSASVARLYSEVEIRLESGDPDGLQIAIAWLEQEVGLGADAARELAEHLATARAALGALPTDETLVAERFFDEAGDQHMVIHSPYGSRLNRAWGLALRKRFCQSFNFELQAAADEDSIVLSLGPTHSFPLEDAFDFLHSGTVRGVLEQAVLDAPLFPIRWRWNATRSLAVLRFRGGRRTPAPLLRQQAEDLAAVVFPDQLACLENIVGEREIPNHPLVRQTLVDCLEESMDIEGLEALLKRLERGELRRVARDLAEPSPLAAQILAARPYSYLDDAPLEERRTQAVRTRRWLDPKTASDLGALDLEAIERVRAEAWPDPRDAEELNDALATIGFLTEAEGRASGWEPLFHSLVETRRAAVLRGARNQPLWVAAERLPDLLGVVESPEMSPPIEAPPRVKAPESREAALVALLRGRLSALGPVTVEALGAPLGISLGETATALAALEGEGSAMRGRFTPGVTSEEWCDRRLLARIHRATIERLRREIEPVSAADLLRFLGLWQRAVPGSRARGAEGLAAVLAQLEGFEAPAGVWESEILPARVEGYDPAWLDALCFSGRLLWRRASPPASSAAKPRSTGRGGPVRATPIAFFARETMPAWEAQISASGAEEIASLSNEAQTVHAALRQRGASFSADLVRATGLLPNRLDAALGELVARGLAAADGFAGLRSLIGPADRRIAAAKRRNGHAGGLGPIGPAGRWALLASTSAESAAEISANDSEDAAAEIAARTLLSRYGVVLRKLLERESLAPPWRSLLRAFHRLEARGEIRGGRFVHGFSGEQFALPEAVGQLRRMRREEPAGALVAISAADPLNLAGILTPGERISAVAGQRILLRDGLPIAHLAGREVRYLTENPEIDAAEAWRIEDALRRPSATRGVAGIPGGISGSRVTRRPRGARLPPIASPEKKIAVKPVEAQFLP
ncbi:MAG TPA: DEAD/DEAH box helicase [Thermoanaerobaculia bacterium]|jgi:ATP-dependent Lhr-like helicase|nr:DEAD/DEAH box helicase [Thermoanaerobaculia bacterium]